MIDITCSAFFSSLRRPHKQTEYIPNKRADSDHGKPASDCYIIKWLMNRDDCAAVCMLHTTWCGWKAACCKEQVEEFALINYI